MSPEGAGRPYSTSDRTCNFYCKACGWASNTSNAQGQAAQHHDRTGHIVEGTVKYRIVYGDPAAAERRRIPRE